MDFAKSGERVDSLWTDTQSEKVDGKHVVVSVHNLPTLTHRLPTFRRERSGGLVERINNNKWIIQKKKTEDLKKLVQ